VGEIGIIVREGEDFEKAFKRFKRVFERAGVIRQLKRHMYYEKPSEIKKKKMNALKRELEQLRKRNKKK